MRCRTQKRRLPHAKIRTYFFVGNVVQSLTREVKESVTVFSKFSILKEMEEIKIMKQGCCILLYNIRRNVNNKKKMCVS